MSTMKHFSGLEVRTAVFLALFLFQESAKLHSIFYPNWQSRQLLQEVPVVSFYCFDVLIWKMKEPCNGRLHYLSFDVLAPVGAKGKL